MSDMSTETRDMLYATLMATRANLEALETAVSIGCFPCEDCGDASDAEQHDGEIGDEYDEDDPYATAPHPYRSDDEGDPAERLYELPLEIVWEMGEPFAVVLGTGGPHVEIRGGGRHDGTAYTLHGYWAGEHVTASGSGVTFVGSCFRSLVEES